MRILYLAYGRQSGVIKFLTQSLEKQNVNCSIFDAGSTLNYRNKNYKIPSIRPSNVFNTLLALAKFKSHWKEGFIRTDFAFQWMTKNAERYAREHEQEFDIILQSGVMFSAAKKKPKKPYFLYLDNTTAIHEKPRYRKGIAAAAMTSRTWKAMEKSTYEMADRIFTMSQLVKRSLIIDYGISAQKIVVVGAGPNLERLPQPHKKSYSNRRLLFVGKEFLPKGGEVLKKAFQDVRQQFPDAQLIIVGPREVVRGPGITWKGFLDFSEMPKEYEQASIFVLPTLRDAFGLSFLEAMAYQLPCVGTDIQAIPEIIDHGVTGFLVPLFDPDSLSARIIALLENEELMQRMGEQGFDKVMKNYTWNTVAQRIISELQIVCQIPS